MIMGYKCGRCGYRSDDNICPFCGCKMYLIDTWSNIRDEDDDYDGGYERDYEEDMRIDQLDSPVSPIWVNDPVS